MNSDHEKIRIFEIIKQVSDFVYDGEETAAAVVNTSWYVCIMKR